MSRDAAMPRPGGEAVVSPPSVRGLSHRVGVLLRVDWRPTHPKLLREVVARPRTTRVCALSCSVFFQSSFTPRLGGYRELGRGNERGAVRRRSGAEVGGGFGGGTPPSDQTKFAGAKRTRELGRRMVARRCVPARVWLLEQRRRCEWKLELSHRPRIRRVGRQR